MIKAVVFDIGNVLLEWHPERFYDSAIGAERRKALFAAVDLHSMNVRIDLGDDFRDTVAGVAAQYPEWQTEIMMWHDRWVEMAQPAIGHSVHLMEQLQAKGVQVFSLTNFGIGTYDVAAEIYPFMTRFDRDFISGHMRMMKPSPEIYTALEETSGLSGDALIFTDDRPENIAAASARGWKTHLFEGPAGWAARLVSEGLLTENEAAQ